MANVSGSNLTDRFLRTDDLASGMYYAVYDSCVTNHVPSWDLAFIEERKSGPFEEIAENEKRFLTLRQAKYYADSHFESGAEYISLKQSTDPDNILYIIADKITYLMA